MNTYSSFDGYRCIASGSLETNALAVKRALERGSANPVLLFDDLTGRSIDVDMRGSDDDMVTRMAAAAAVGGCAGPAGAERSSPQVSPDVPQEVTAGGPRGRGRPRLGVVPREVTLLPRHWEWLATQPGGASVALRKLVDAARRDHADEDKTRRSRERAYHFMLAIAGNLPGFEEATRALFANDRPRFGELVAEWPPDVRDHAAELAFGGETAVSTPMASRV